MNQINALIVQGNIVKDPETVTTTAGNDVSKFPIAINRFYKDKDGNIQKEVGYFDIEAWGNLSKWLNENNRKKDRPDTCNGRRNRGCTAVVSDNPSYGDGI